SDGTYPVVATVTSLAGNTAADTQNVIVDSAAGTNGSAPTVTLSDDANNDGVINAAELTANLAVTIGLPAGAVVGDTLQVSDGITPQNIVLDADDILAGTVATTFPAPAHGDTLTVTAVLIDQIGNTSAQGSDSAVIDTSADNDDDGNTVSIDAITTDSGTVGDFITNDTTLIISG